MQDNQNNNEPEYNENYIEQSEEQYSQDYQYDPSQEENAQIEEYSEDIEYYQEGEHHQEEKTYQNEEYYYHEDEIPQEPVENIDLSEAIIQDASYELTEESYQEILEPNSQELTEEDIEYQQDEYYEDDYEDIENYIEIDEDNIITFSDWVYDAIINKTLKEVELNYDYEFIELLNNAKRGADGFLNLSYLESRDYRILCRYISKAYKNSYYQEKRIYTRKAHNQFLKIMQNLIDTMVKDERYTMF